MRQRFGFNVRKIGKRGKQTPPSKLPDIVFTERETEPVPTTTGIPVSTMSSATPTTSSMGGTSSAMELGLGAMGQTIGSVTIAESENDRGEVGHLPIISSVISMSTLGGTDEPEPMETELEYVSTVTKSLEMPGLEVELTRSDLEIKKEMVDEDLHPGDPEYYLSLQYVYRNLKKAEKVVEDSRRTENYMDNLNKCSSIKQIFEKMKSAYSQHAKRTGKVLPKGWDMVKLAEPVPPRGVKGMKMGTEEYPDYQPASIHFLNPQHMGLKQIGEYITEFEAELEELNKLREKGIAKDWTKAKMDRKEILQDKIAEFEIERENRLAKMGESRRPGDTEEEEDPKGQESSESPWDRTKPKKGTYPTVGPNGPGNLNIQGDWEGPIELFEFEDIDEGWTSCTTGYYWHKLMGGGICQFEENWYRNWEFDYEPPAEEVIGEESEDIQLEDPEIPQAPIPGSSRTSEDPTPPMTRKTVQQMVQKSRRPPIKMTPEEVKTRENKIAHIVHLREEMKKLLEKWEKEVENKKDG